jgi:hypothetical protein
MKKTVLNKENVRKVIEAIKNEDNFFNMVHFVIEGSMLENYSSEELGNPPACGTASCIGGWAVAIKLKESGEVVDYLSDEIENKFTFEAAGEWLGLNGTDSTSLFLGGHLNLDTITRAETIEVLEHLVATGVVDWSIVREE